MGVIFIMSILFISHAEWIVIYDGLNDSDFPLSDHSNWEQRLVCSTGDLCGGNPRYINCDQNQNKMIRLDSDCQRWVSNNIPLVDPYFKIKIVVGVYFFDQNDDEFRIVIASTKLFSIRIADPEVPYGKLNCWSGGPNKFN